MSKPARYIVRYPAATMLVSAVLLGAFGYLFQTFWLDRATLLAPWQTALFLITLHLWTFPSIEGNALALHLRGKSKATLAAFAYGNGYSWAAMMFVMLAHPEQILFDGVIWACAGAFFGIFLAALAKPDQGGDIAVFYDDEHILDDSGMRRTLFIVWPFIMFAILGGALLLMILYLG